MKKKILIAAGALVLAIIGFVALISMPIKEQVRERKFYENHMIIEYELKKESNKDVIIERNAGDFDKLVNDMDDAIKKLEYYSGLQLGYITLAKNKKPLDLKDVQKLHDDIESTLQVVADERGNNIRSYNHNLDFSFGAIRDSYNTLKASTYNLLNLSNKKGTVEQAESALEKSKVEISVIDFYKDDLKNKILKK